MAFSCLSCRATQVTEEGALCATCRDRLKAEDEAERAAEEAAASEPIDAEHELVHVDKWKNKGGRNKSYGTGPTPLEHTMLEDQLRCYRQLQRIVKRELFDTNKGGVEPRKVRGEVVSTLIIISTKINQTVDALRKLKDTQAERASKKTPAQKFEISVRYLESGQVTPAQRAEAVKRLLAVDGRTG